jgi:FixJ family two-component response regulator
MEKSVPIIFIVDDDISIRESLELLMVSAGWQPVTFACAQMFLTYPRAYVPNCLVLDVSLPDLSGLDLQSLIGQWRCTHDRSGHESRGSRLSHQAVQR